MKTKLGWKVVIITDRGELRSLRLYFGCCAYHVDKWARPMSGCGPLAVFNTRKSAMMFIDKTYGPYSTDKALYRCEYMLSEYRSVWCCDDGSEIGLPLDMMPKGTVLASKVRLKGTNTLIPCKTKGKPV